MALLDQLTTSKDTDFKSRVTIAMLVSAVQIINEPAETANHDLRIALAKKVVRNPSQWAEVFSLMVVTNAEISLLSTDNDIQFTVNSIWEAIAVSVP